MCGPPRTGHSKREALGMKELESGVENTIRRAAKRFKGRLIYWKFTVPAMRGVPDRILLIEGGRVVFFELKRKGEKPRKLQEFIHTQLRGFGFPVYVFDNAAEAIAKIEELVNGNRTV